MGLTDDCPHGRCDGSGLVVDEATRTTRPCSCRPLRIRAKRARRFATTIPAHYRHASLDNLPPRVDPAVAAIVGRYVASIEEQLDAGRGLWLLGGVGSGKTTLAMICSRAALEAGRTVAIYSLPRLLAEIRDTFDSRETSYLALIDRLSEVDLLHVDDVGAEKSSPWVLEQLYALVNARYENERAMVLTTNIIDRDELCGQITERTVSRLTEMCEQVPVF